MAQILNADPQSNPRLRQIYQILLLAGYFRIRIASLKPFDKVIGGLAWCITCSNFEVDVEYNDQMQIGQKIKVSEKICDALKKMRCPYNIQPFQLQGLDLNSIYPLVQWLIKFVYETREYRQKFNTALSNFLGKDILKIQEQAGQADSIGIVAKRTTKNAEIKKASRRDPLRVYSTLIEFGDVTSIAAYNKLCAIITGKVPNPDKDKKPGAKQTSKDNPQSQSQQQSKAEMSLASYLFEMKSKHSDEEAKIIDTVHQSEKNSFKKLEKKLTFSGDELEKLVTQNRDKIEQALKQDLEQQDPQQVKLAKLLAAENESYQSQKQILAYKLQSLQRLEKAALEKLEQSKARCEQIVEVFNNQKQKIETLQQAKKEVEQQLKQKAKLNDLKTKQLEKLVDERVKLKAEKAQLKKTVKAKLEELKKQKVKAQQSIPEVDEQVFNKMVAETKIKKKIYDERFLELTIVNQQMAILQRKAQNFTSPTEIAQYHQRFLELFESINRQIQTKRDLYAFANHLQSIKLVVSNYVQVMRTFKQNYGNSKSKDQKRQFIDNLKEVYKTMENNLRNSEVVQKKVSDTRNSHYEEYTSLIKVEREFFTVLKELKNQVELAEYQAARRG